MRRDEILRLQELFLKMKIASEEFSVLKIVWTPDNPV